MLKGRMHSIETMGAVDGPGLRYVLFLQGCPLKCLYCHNRDAWSTDSGREISVDQIIEDLKKYQDFIKLSNGGITVSGGEPTLQHSFVTELFKECRKLGIHTALDTSGHANIEDVSELLEYTDLVLLDIKHSKNEQLKRISGVSDEKMKRFRKYLSEKNVDVWIRYVLVPGYTDNCDDLRAVRKIIEEIDTVKKVEVLPYHSMGKYKWKSLKEDYPLEDVPEPSHEEVLNAKRILEGIC